MKSDLGEYTRITGIIRTPKRAKNLTSSATVSYSRITLLLIIKE